MELSDLREISQGDGEPILLLVLDGLGGLPGAEGDDRTALEAAETPNMDRLARRGGCGLHDPVAPGITPGSGPGHLALFGYDPLRYRIGRGVLEGLGIGFDLGPGDVAARGNFCTLDAEGRVADRRAGRIETGPARALARRLDGIGLPGVEVLVREVREHRFLLVLRPRGEELDPAVEDTDPGRPGEPPAPPTPRRESAGRTAELVRRWVDAAREELRGEEPANGVLLRGFSSLPDWPAFGDVWGLRPLAVAAYPMYRGVARLVGMDAAEAPDDPGSLPGVVRERLSGHDYVFAHVKGTDRAGEDGDRAGKIAVLEEADAMLPELAGAVGGVTLVTGDHSTPAALGSHSWHPVPFVLAGGRGHPASGARSFGERGCRGGSLGRRRGAELMRLAASHAGRMRKFGA